MIDRSIHNSLSEVTLQLIYDNSAAPSDHETQLKKLESFHTSDKISKLNLKDTACLKEHYEETLSNYISAQIKLSYRQLTIGEPNKSLKILEECAKRIELKERFYTSENDAELRNQINFSILRISNIKNTVPDVNQLIDIISSKSTKSNLAKLLAIKTVSETLDADTIITNILDISKENHTLACELELSLRELGIKALENKQYEDAEKLFGMALGFSSSSQLGDNSLINHATIFSSIGFGDACYYNENTFASWNTFNLSRHALRKSSSAKQEINKTEYYIRASLLIKQAVILHNEILKKPEFVFIEPKKGNLSLEDTQLSEALLINVDEAKHIAKGFYLQARFIGYAIGKIDNKLSQIAEENLSRLDEKYDPIFPRLSLSFPLGLSY